MYRVSSWLRLVSVALLWSVSAPVVFGNFEVNLQTGQVLSDCHGIVDPTLIVVCREILRVCF